MRTNYSTESLNKFLAGGGDVPKESASALNDGAMNSSSLSASPIWTYH